MIMIVKLKLLGFKYVRSEKYQERTKINKTDTREIWEKNYIFTIPEQCTNNSSCLQVLITNNYKQTFPTPSIQIYFSATNY